MQHSLTTKIADLFSLAWHIFSTHYQQLLMISMYLLGWGYILLSLIPMQLVATPLQQDMYSYAFTVQGGYELALIQGLLQFIIAIMGVFTTIATFIYVRALVDGHHALSIKQAIHQARQHLFGVLGTIVMQMFFLFCLFLLLIIPGIIFLIYWIFTVYVVVHHGKHWKAALDESKAIIRGRRWKTLGYMIVLYMPMVIISAVLQRGLKASYGIWGRVVLPDLVHNIAMMVLQSFYAVIASIFFLARDRSRVPLHHGGHQVTHHHTA